MIRVRFAPSPTGYLHIGSARTFIFNWLYARRNGGTMILRIDDTDIERNTEISLNSIYDGLNWLGLNWDEEYRQSDRLELHRQLAYSLLNKGFAYRDFTSREAWTLGVHLKEDGPRLFNPDQRNMPREESDERALREEYVIRFRVPHEPHENVEFFDAVYGKQSKSTENIEDFALLRSDRTPTYHLASCADDVSLGITHVVRGQDHLANTFKHVLLFRAVGFEPQFAHLPLLVAPDGAKLSKRIHGSVVSVTTYRDAGFLPHAFMNFLCLLGWSPKNDREVMSREELIQSFSFEGVNRSNAVVNFTEEKPIEEDPFWHARPFDDKAVWLNAETIRTMPVVELSAALLPFVREKYPHVDFAQVLRITPLIQERIKFLNDALDVGDFFFEEPKSYDSVELIPKKGDDSMAECALSKALAVLADAEFTHDGLESSLRTASLELGIKPGQMFEPIRVAVCGRKNAPPLFGTLEVLGREICLGRIGRALAQLRLDYGRKVNEAGGD